MSVEHFDVLIVGAGLSGIGTGCHLTMKCPKKSFILLEAREASGGTWDLFRYPGIRSDSDMYTLGYSFRPWTEAKAIADGPAILKYVRETADAYGIAGKIRYRHRVRRISWSSDDAVWTVEAERGPEKEVVRFTCNFLFSCGGYYDYENGYTPEFQGTERFQGRIVHPQHWPDDLDYAGKKVVVIGSGATAVTLVPAMTDKAAHVTMLQRSPSYVVSRPAEDALANWLKKLLPAKIAYGITRWRNVGLQLFIYRMSRRKPAEMKKQLIDMVKAELGPDYDVGTHFTPRYNPWDQRLCLVPDSDLFASIRSGRASVVTDHIEAFTEKGLRLKSGQELEADIIVTATGLVMRVLSGVSVFKDEQKVDVSKALMYKGMMMSDVPNMAFVFGYTNASWTLKADLTCDYVCRMLNYMDQRGYETCTPARDPSVVEEPFVNFESGYIQRALAQLPRQGATTPWKLYQNYALDFFTLRFGKLDDGTMKFERRQQAQKAA